MANPKYGKVSRQEEKEIELFYFIVLPNQKHYLTPTNNNVVWVISPYGWYTQHPLRGR
jgi:hypothetical protein